MFFDKRMRWDVVEDFASIYILANYAYFANSERADMHPSEQELIRNIRAWAVDYVPPICRDRERKLAARDCARNAWGNAMAAATSGAYGTMRREFTAATNGVLRITMGAELYAVMESSLEMAIKLTKNPVGSFNEGETELLRMNSFFFRRDAINAGLVKP